MRRGWIPHRRFGSASIVAPRGSSTLSGLFGSCKYGESAIDRHNVVRFVLLRSQSQVRSECKDDGELSGKSGNERSNPPTTFNCHASSSSTLQVWSSRIESCVFIFQSTEISEPNESCVPIKSSRAKKWFFAKTKFNRDAEVKAVELIDLNDLKVIFWQTTSNDFKIIDPRLHLRGRNP